MKGHEEMGRLFEYFEYEADLLNQENHIDIN